jgi:hypothetical protein
VPVLPCFGSFLEFPAAPTPYIIGVHSSFRRLIEHMHGDCLQDCLKVDLDGASVFVPQSVDDLICGTCEPDFAANPRYSLAANALASATNSNSNTNTAKSTYGLPHHLYESTLNLLYQILKPDVLRADEIAEFCRPACAQPSSNPLHHKQQVSKEAAGQSVAKSADSTATSNSEVDKEATVAAHVLTTNVNHLSADEIEAVWLDKMVRAVFVRLFAQLFAGYRYCLLIIRINPRPVICFDKASFLCNHGLGGSGCSQNEFMSRVLDSMSFQRFIEERGPSYRHCDVFDDLYADVQSQLAAELERLLSATHYQNHDLTDSLAMQHLRQIAQKLYKYEYPQTVQAKNKPDTSHSNSDSSCLLTTPNRSYSKIKLPTTAAYRRIHSEPFPLLDANHVQKLILHNQQNQVS